MQTAPTNWDALFSAAHRTEYRFLINGVEYLADDIKGTPTITKKLSDNFIIGQFSSASLTFEIYPKSNIPKAAPVVAYCRLTSKDGSTVTSWLEQGHFWIQKRSSRDGIMSLICRDAAMMAGDSYTDKTAFTEWPQPMTAVVSEIASIMGVPIDPRTVIKTGADFMVDYPNEDLLMSEILCMIGAAHGGNWIMTETGKLRLVPMLVTDQSSSFTLGGKYQRFTPLAIPSVVSRVTLSDDAGNQYTIGDDSGEEMTAECDYATPGVLASIVQDNSAAVENGRLKLNSGTITKGLLDMVLANASIANGSLTTVSRVSYQPYALDGAFIDPRMELGDFFTVTYKGQTYTVLYASANVRLNVSYAADFSLQNKDTTNDEYPYKTARDLRASRYVSTTKTYHGNRINRAEGFVSEYTVDGSPVARLIANSNVFSMQQKVNGAWEDRIYFDPVDKKYKIVGDVTVEGTLTADALSTPGGVNITGANITTGTISADRLDFTPINNSLATIQRDIDGLTIKVEDVSSEAISTVVVQYALGTSSSVAPDSGWSATAPAWETGKYMWQRTVTTYADSTPEVPHVSTSDPTCIQGAGGASGLNVATVFLYKRADSTPAKPSADVVYTFSDGSMSGITGGWTKDIPATNGKPCYVIQTTASNTGATDTIDKDRWSSPVVLVEDGTDGQNGTNGTDGVGIQSVSVSYAVTANPPSSVNPETLSWQTTIPTVPNGSYLWIRTITDYTNSTDTVTYAYSRQGVDGQTGQAGTSVTVSSILYQIGTSPTTPPSGTWSENPVSPGQGQYLWTKTTFSNGSVAYSIAYQGVNGQNGQNGTDGIGISSVTVTYGVSASAATQPASWQSTIPTVPDGQYLWIRTVTDYTDSSISDTVTYTYAKQGEDGENGQAGTSVSVSSIQYQAGASATTAPAGSWSNSPVSVAQGQYLWTKTTFSDNSVAYGVARQGIDGTNGDDGVGINSVTVAYGVSASASAQPSSWQNSLPVVADGQYLWTRTTTDYTDPNLPDTVTYTYAKQGEDGDTGQAGTSVSVSSIQYQAGASATTAPTGSWSNSPVTVAQGQYLWTKTTYSDNSVAYGVARQGVDGQNGTDGIGISSVTVTYGVSASAATQPASWQSTIPTVPDGQYLWTKTITDYTDSSIPDTVTYTYAKQGEDGDTGQAGTSVSVSSIQYQQGDSATTAPTGSWSNSVVSVDPGKYLWTKTTFSDNSVAYGVARQGVNGQNGQNGQNGAGISSVTVTYGVSASASAQPSSWQSTIPTVPDGQYLWTKTITDYTDSSIPDTVTYTYAKQGEDGDTGQAGTSVSVSSILYQAGTSPTTPPSGTWETSIPSVEQGQYLWTKTTFSDNSVAYGVARQGVNGQNGQNGQNGAAGYSTAIAYLYKRSTTAPTVDWTTDLTYSFADEEISGNAPSGWYKSVPSGNDPLYMTMATAYSNTATDTIGYTEWTTPILRAEDGINGKGVSSIVPEYYLSTSDVSPTGGSWVTTSPAWASGKYIWTRSHIYYDDGTDATTTPVLDAAINDLGEKANKITWLVASGTSASNFTMTSRAISQVAQTLTLTAVSNSSQGGQSIGSLVAGTSSPTDGSTGYAFSVSTVDGITLYTSTNAGVDNSVCYGRILFNQSAETEVTLECISYGESNFDFGVISDIDVTLGVTRQLDSSGVFHSFKGESSATPQKLTMTIPAGSHFITFKYVKDGSQSSGDDCFKLKIYTNSVVASTLTLKSNNASLSSARITFSGLVTFNDLSSAGSTTINGANISTGTISADRIDVANLHVTSVYYSSSDDYKILEGTVYAGFLGAVAIGVQNSSFSTSGIVYYGDIHVFAKYGDTSAAQFRIERSNVTILGDNWKIGNATTPFYSIHLKDTVYLYDSYGQTWHELYAFNGNLFFDSTRLT